MEGQLKRLQSLLFDGFLLLSDLGTITYLKALDEQNAAKPAITEKWDSVVGRGLRVAVKDCIDVAGVVTTAGSPAVAACSRRRPR